eukprot:TRINITY_DN65597_c0_g1_i1.p1 TRINITY_DN65597_c0_g1~~TRINITY_DN65597_c0_g1_i1.p1  ORF type:complete len:270 (-),score=48.56 TRINITY_DN65597_c0_g1_i1:48-857(-)
MAMRAIVQKLLSSRTSHLPAQSFGAGLTSKYLPTTVSGQGFWNVSGSRSKLAIFLCKGSGGSSAAGSSSSSSPSSKSNLKIAYSLDQVGPLDIVSLPSRHFVWTIALTVFRFRYLDAWDRGSFYNGAEDAFKLVFERLANGNPESLDGLVGEPLLERFKQDCAAMHNEGWLKPPTVKARIVGLLWASTSQENIENPMLKVEVAMLSKELYTYSDHSSSTSKDMELWHLQRVAFQRSLTEGSPWQLVDLAAEPWYEKHTRSGSIGGEDEI